MKKNDKMIIYFLLSTFLISGIAWGSLILLARGGQLEFGQPIFMILFMIGGYGPTFGTFIAIALSEKKPKFSEYWKRLLRFKVSFWYYLSPLVLLMFLGLVPAIVRGEMSTKFSSLVRVLWGTVPALFISSFFFGGLEELGWRGFLQHELQKKMKIWLVYPLVWVIWAIWHYPLFHLPGVSQYGQNFWIFSVYALFFSMILGWLYGRTHSIPIAILGHTLVNVLSAIGYLNFLGRDNLHWATFLIVFAVLIGIHLIWPVERIDQD